MDAITEVLETEATNEIESQARVIDLSEWQLAMVGGGIGDVVFS
jgi:hypothetical protein